MPTKLPRRALALPSLALLTLVLLALAPALAAEPELSVEAPTTLTGLPVELKVTAPEGVAQRVSVRVDGRDLGEHEVTDGALSLEDLNLTPGIHQVEVRTTAEPRLEAAARLRVLPGWISVLPPLLAIGLALITKDVMVALFLGILGGCLILFEWSPFVALARSIDQFIVPAVADSSHASILVFTLMLGGMVGLITKNGGTHGIVERLKKYATTPRRGQLATYFLGLLVFFDDYANTLIVGPTMRPITDKLRVSREKLAYIVDSTAAPMVSLVPISTWVGFEIGLIGAAFAELELPFDPYGMFIATIPYRFYSIFAVLLVGTLIITRLDFGPMRRAEERARTRGLLLAEDAAPIADYSSHDVEPASDIPKRPINALLPILTVIFVTVLGLYLSGVSGLGEGDEASMRNILANADSYKALLWASLSGMLVAMGLALGQKLLTVRESTDAMMAGFKSMFMALVILVLAWALSSICSSLHTADYLVRLTQGNLGPEWLPALTFVLAAATAFATGSSWGAMGILEPLIIPICHNLSIGAGHAVASEPYMLYMTASIAGVLAGSIWGDHCSPISDTSILSSMASGSDHIAHVRTQLPYALAIGLLGILIGNIPTAFGMPVGLSLVLGAAIVIGGVLGLGRWSGQRPTAG
ncbi:MAG: Na+/H+ antiporter NhaC family protein [Acidobacteriota bacterium]